MIHLDDAPPEIAKIVRHAQADEERYVVSPWPPPPAKAGIFAGVDHGPPIGWQINHERFSVIALRELSGKWFLTGCDDNGVGFNTYTMFATVWSWFQADPNDMAIVAPLCV